MYILFLLLSHFDDISMICFYSQMKYDSMIDTLMPYDSGLFIWRYDNTGR